MVFSSEDKAVIKNDLEEKGWTAYKIWKEHPTKKWVLRSVQRLVNKIKETGTFERRPGSGRLVTATTKENADIVDLLARGEPRNAQKPSRYCNNDWYQSKLGKTIGQVMRL